MTKRGVAEAEALHRHNTQTNPNKIAMAWELQLTTQVVCPRSAPSRPRPIQNLDLHLTSTSTTVSPSLAAAELWSSSSSGTSSCRGDHPTASTSFLRSVVTMEWHSGRGHPPPNGGLAVAFRGGRSTPTTTRRDGGV
ncbi:unnamed protein product [Calypogeia fissa]